ncbi:HNH endonuclease [Luteimonas pelagia]
MWQDDCAAFAQRHLLSEKQARQFQCTAEHLQPRSLGGTLRVENIAAACWCCNQRRGRLRVPADPDMFRAYARRRCGAGKWHSRLPAGTPNKSFKPAPIRDTT